MNLVLDIGNTLTKAAWFSDKKMEEMMNTSDLSPSGIRKIILHKPVNKAIVSSVGNISHVDIIKHFTAIESFILLDHMTPLPFEVLYKTRETLGHDRIAAVAGANSKYPGRNILIIDTGTAITFDFLSADGKHNGGNISPGMQVRFRALHEFTGKLPLINKDPSFPWLGTSTQKAIGAGVQNGIIYELNGYISDFGEKYPDCQFIITGGDANFFVPKLKSTIFAEPDLVLYGLNVILEYNISKKNT